MEDGNVGEHEFLWQIENFSACAVDTMTLISSPVLRATSLDDSRWKVVMAPGSEADDSFISLRLCRERVDDGPSVLHLALEFCLIDRDGRDRFHLQFPRSLFKRNYGTVFLRFVRRSDVFEDEDVLLPGDVLTLRCRVRKYNRGRFTATRSVVRTKIHVERSAFLWPIPGSAGNAAFLLVKSSVAGEGLVLGCEWDGPTRPERAVRLSLRPKSVSECRIFVSASIRALDRLRGRTVREVKAEHFFEAGSGDAWFLPSASSDELVGLLDSRRLDLACDFAVSDGSLDTQTSKTLVPHADTFRATENTLPQDIRCVYESTINADILLKAYNGLQLYWAHAMILSTRSGVFRAVLNRFDVEKRLWSRATGASPNIPESSGSVVVGDETVTASVMCGMDYAQVAHVDTFVLGQMLQCMYTDELHPVSLSNAMHLYSAGVRFDFRLLREKSVVYMKDRISLNSVYLILVFADSNCIGGLKRECLDFLSEDWVGISNSDKWVTFRQGHQDLAMEIANTFKSESSVGYRYAWNEE